ncbi:MAG: hypothetical protein K8F31_05440 [Roseovarius sp.]|nr:hypothetical protein [Roseovarius sp.]
MTLHICGNSHVRALRAGLRALGDDAAQRVVVFPLGTADNEAHEFSTIEGGRVVLTNARFRTKLRKNFGFDSFDPAQRWGICLGTHNARLWRSDSWLRAAPAWLELSGFQPVPEAVFARMVAADQQHVRVFIDRLLRTGLRPFVISAPWPVRHHPAMAETGIRPEIVQAIDARARALFGEWLAERGIALVAPPPETADARGFLRPRYAKGGDDHYHGNARYGRLMMLKILAEEAGMAAA